MAGVEAFERERELTEAITPTVKMRKKMRVVRKTFFTGVLFPSSGVQPIAEALLIFQVLLNEFRIDTEKRSCRLRVIYARLRNSSILIYPRHRHVLKSSFQIHRH